MGAVQLVGVAICVVGFFSLLALLLNRQLDRRGGPGSTGSRSKIQTHGSPGDADVLFARKKHWDPFARESQRSEQVKAARRRATGTGKTDYYAMLGLNPEASLADIERVYRYHVSQIHPDRYYEDPQRRHLAEEKLKQLNGIMRILRDPKLRANYDTELRGE